MYNGAGANSASATKNAYDVSGPIPVSRGCNLLTFSHLEQPWNFAEDDEGSKRAKSYWYSIAGLLQWGPTQKICGIYANGDRVTDAISLTGDVTAYHHIWGDLGMRMRIYKGTETQPVDPRLNGVYGGRFKKAGINFKLNAAPNKHSAYSGLVWVMFDTFCTAWACDKNPTGGTHINDINFLTYTLNEVINPGEESERYGVNPIGIGYDLWRSVRYGLGMTEDRIPLAQWQAKADEFRSERGGNSYISPLYKSRANVESVMADLLSYYHGYMPRDAKSILADWVHYDTPVDTSTLPVIRSSDFVEEPEIVDNDLSQMYSAIEVKCKDFDNDLGDASVMASSPYGAFLTPEAKTVSADMPHFHDVAQGRLWANRELDICQYPRLTVEGTVPREVARDIKLSNLCLFRDDVAAQDFVCRMIKKKDVRGKGLQINLEEEPGQWGVTDAAEGGTSTTGDPREEEEEHAPSAITNIRGWIVPAALRAGDSVEMAVLLDSPDYASAAEVYISATGAFAGEEQQLDDLESWISCGSLLASATTTDAAITFNPSDASSTLARSFTATEIAAGYILILIDDEVMILGALTDAGTDSVTYAVTRGAFGTAAAAHETGAIAWIFIRDDLQRWTHALLEVAAVDVWIDVIPTNALGSGTPSGAIEVTGVGVEDTILDGGIDVLPSTENVVATLSVSGAAFACFGQCGDLIYAADNAGRVMSVTHLGVVTTLTSALPITPTNLTADAAGNVYLTNGSALYVVQAGGVIVQAGLAEEGTPCLYGCLSFAAETVFASGYYAIDGGYNYRIWTVAADGTITVINSETAFNALVEVDGAMYIVTEAGFCSLTSAGVVTVIQPPLNNASGQTVPMNSMCYGGGYFWAGSRKTSGLYKLTTAGGYLVDDGTPPSDGSAAPSYTCNVIYNNTIYSAEAVYDSVLYGVSTGLVSETAQLAVSGITSIDLLAGSDGYLYILAESQIYRVKL